MHLKYWYNEAGMIYNENRHAQTVMKELGITYTHSTPQSMGDQFWFWNCSNIPDNLPSYIEELKIENPLEYVGWGLSEEEAKEIKRLSEKETNLL